MPGVWPSPPCDRSDGRTNRRTRATRARHRRRPRSADGVRSAITALMRELVPQESPLRDIHDVRVRETSIGLVVNFHCRAEPSLQIDVVHAAVDELERRLKERRRDVHRVIGHAEPAT